MILLLGGTTEGVAAAKAFVDAGHPVLVSQATEIDMELPASPLIQSRRGRLDAGGFERLVRAKRIRAIVDASHPFARELHRTTARVSRSTGIPRIRLERPAIGLPPGVVMARDHLEAAAKAFAIGKTLLLTTGSRSLPLYARLAIENGATLWARIAPSDESREAVANSGIDPRRVAWARGPFPVSDTEDLLRRSGARVLVAKDSGAAGGISERIEAASRCRCEVVVVARPDPESDSVSDAADAVRWLEDLPRRDF